MFMADINFRQLLLETYNIEKIQRITPSGRKRNRLLEIIYEITRFIKHESGYFKGVRFLKEALDEEYEGSSMGYFSAIL